MPAPTKPRARRGVSEAQTRSFIATNLRVSRREALNAARRADALRDTSMLMHLHNAIAALDEAVACNG